MIYDPFMVVFEKTGKLKLDAKFEICNSNDTRQ
jgi:hypothetical protein